MTFLFLILIIVVGGILGGIILASLYNAWYIPTFAPETPFLEFEKAVIISAVLFLVFLLLFTKNMKSYKLSQWMKNKEKYIKSIDANKRGKK